jgi:EAL domain-containing protein (putative c-di-GMP-specific phosphodiesterase class I)
MHAQPIVEVATSEPQMHELLIRMHADEGGFLGPGGFLPQAERFGLMNDIDHWVVGEAVRVARDRPVTVNVSAQSIADVFFTSWAQRMIDEAEAPPENLLFEITETSALEDFDLARQLVVGLTEFGCRFALDDFGTGYGSFTDLKHLPVTHLKIDMSFVREMGRSENDQRVVAAIVGVARDFGMQTIAEGVEDAVTLDLLGQVGVDYAQGYFLGRPAPLDEYDEPPRTLSGARA